MGPGTLSARARVEERWRSDGDDVQVRLRQQLRYRLPLGHSHFGAVLAAEAFELLNAVDRNWRSGLDQGRLYGGIDAPIAPHLVGELGYLHQVSDAAHGERIATNVLQLTLSLRH